MIYYPIEALTNAGIKEIMVVTGGNNAGDFLRLLGNGKEFGLNRIHYAYQEGEGGIAEALSLAEAFAEGRPICVVLGDNIIENNIIEAVGAYKAQGGGARIMLKEVPDPERFGVAALDEKLILEIEEKPAAPKSNHAVVGCYAYDERVFDIIDTVKPSARGELEITAVNNRYIERGELQYSFVRGRWTDAGTFESLGDANSLLLAIDNKILP